ncbi:hypothetical protein ACT2X3_000746 [Enterobacter hormaechei]|uniref:hypothetical protein n=1 Tax=Enterobacter hormaechei TaxID=158836 RepID=UPI0007350780|nr:hypothetical protein [Enterobacter hormaechei]KTJ54406.1 hypothetical protein ASU82_20585 [Enterobacter hormaechei subsp. xiangfangensis]MCC9360923.1 hypothetical protein [Enterobacter hormaechei subsp. xiangfangensis]MCU2724066.1 hypothetical protein [Enterobacter hormaechei subsp. xiangfangensis]MCU2729497.1 hypothetical protein [Enterobacter hormaechei subsp. xiangfangensis]MCU3078525.1 hypothetical protein [Enterobacter hormaechei subsp. xiangfangensis]
MVDSTFNPEPTSTGIRFGRRVIGYSTAIRSLDSGRYDRNLIKGLEVLACIMEAEESGWLELNIEKQIIVWRWLLAAVFITEEREKNGTVDVPNDEGGVDTAVIYSGEHGAISVYPGPERFALANHVEAGAIEKYGPDLGQQMALRIYRDMVVADDNSGFRLSAMGREVFNLLHDSFIEQIQKEGMPDMPVIH